MRMSTCDGRILLNVDGKRYAASYRIDHGIITVTSGSASQRVEVGDVDDPKSVARTVLRAMVTEGRAVLAPIQASDLVPHPAKRRNAEREQFFVFPRSSLRRFRTHH